MKFRTEIAPFKGSFGISHDSRIVLLGSCFADNIGALLHRDGFNAVYNPLGPLFNPESIARILERKKPYSADDFVCFENTWHCMDVASRFRSDEPSRLASMVNSLWQPLADALACADVLILTLGTTHVWRLNGTTVGNCHKLPGKLFSEHNLSVDETVSVLSRAIPRHCRTIITVSPVRYPGEGLAKGFLAKAALRVAADALTDIVPCDYFPTYEIMNDDLRDYRFYSADMRHPSEVAVNYIYEKFCEAYFSAATVSEAQACRRAFLREAHIPINPDHGL